MSTLDCVHVQLVSERSAVLWNGVAVARFWDARALGAGRRLPRPALRARRAAKKAFRL